MAENNIELKKRNLPTTTTQTTVNPKQLKQSVDSMMGKSRITAEQFNTLQNSRIFKKKYQDKWFNRENPAFVKQADDSYLANDYRVKDPNKKGEAVYSKDFKKQIFNPYKNQIAWNKLKEDSWSAAAKNFGFDYTPSSQSKPLFKPKEKTEAEAKEWNQIRDELLKRGTKQTEIPTDLNEAKEMLNEKQQEEQQQKEQQLLILNNILKKSNSFQSPSLTLPASEFNINDDLKFKINNLNKASFEMPNYKSDDNYSLTNFSSDLSMNNNIPKGYETKVQDTTLYVKNGNKINYLNYYY